MTEHPVLLRILEWSKKTPDKIAIVFGSKAITYRQLIDASKRITSEIAQRNYQGFRKIAVLLSQSEELAPSLLATWMSGSAYIPLDPIYPKRRILEILEQVDFSCILTTREFLSKFPELAKNNVICVDLLNNNPMSSSVEPLRRSTTTENIGHSNGISDLGEPAHPECPPPHACLAQRDEDYLDIIAPMAYLIFTSGSTGRPKGVEVSAANLLNVLCSFEKKLAVSCNDRLLSITPISFDIFALELFLALICGATCYLTNRETALNPDLLLQAIKQHYITLFQATPSTYSLLIEESWAHVSSLRHLLCGGESWDHKLATSLLHKKPPNCSLWNVYGPTETTIWSSLYLVGSADEIYLSPSVDHTQFYILDDNLNPEGKGELYIGGVGVACGYYNEPKLTSNQFIFAPFAKERLYKTGDLVEYVRKDVYRFIGRKDQQIKIRGFRVELGEIERALLNHHQIRQAVVIYDYFTHREEKTLVAILQTDTDEDMNVRKFLVDRLPLYMIPQYFFRMDSLPLTPNGKVDRTQIMSQLQGVLSRQKN